MTDYNIKVLVDPTTAKPGLDQIQKGLEKLEGAASRLKSLIEDVFAVGSISFGTKELAEYAESYAKVENSIRLVTDSHEQMELVMEKVFDLSQRTGTSFEGNAEIFKKLAFAGQTAGASINELLKAQEDLDKIAVINNETIDQAGESYQALTRSLLEGTVSSRNFITLLRQSPILLKQIADQITGGNIPKLKELAKEGDLTGKQLLDALVKSSAAIDEQFKKTNPTLERAFTTLKNSIVEYVGAIDASDGIIKKFTDLVGLLSSNLDVLSKIIQIVAAFLTIELATSAIPYVIAVLTSLIDVVLLVGAAFYIFSNKIKINIGDAANSVASLYDIFAVVFGEIYRVVSTAAIAIFKGVTAVFNQLISSSATFGKVFSDNFLQDAINQVNLFIDLMVSAINYVGQLTHFHNPSEFQPITATHVKDATELQAEIAARTKAASDAQAALKKQQDELEGGLNKSGPGSGVDNSEKIQKALEKVKDLLKSVAFPQKEYNDDVKALNYLLGQGQISLQSYHDAMDKLNEKVLETNHSIEGGLELGLLKIKDQFKDMSKLVSEDVTKAFQGAEDALTSFVTTGKLNFSSLITSIEQDLARLVVRQSITGPLASLLGSIGSSAFSSGSGIFSSISSFFGGAHDSGGNTEAGQDVLVGEGGPEIWRAPGKGKIIPNNAIGGGGGNTYINVSNNSNKVQANVTQQSDGRGNKTIRIMIDEIVAANVRTAGSGSHQAIRDTFGAQPSVVGR